MIINPYRFAAPPPSGNPFILTQTLGTLRSDFDGCVGFAFTVGGSNITVTDLGRWKVAGNSATHTVKITDSSGATIISVSVDMSTGSAGGYVYASVTPTVLNASTSYRCLTAEANGGDQWYNSNTTVDSTAAYAGTVIAHYQPGCAGGTAADAAGCSFGPPNFKTS